MKEYLDKTGLQDYTTKLTNKYDSRFAPIAAVGSPLVAATAAAMTDQTKVYVYTGSETGYTAGNWYYYNGSAWVSGGIYNSGAVNVDTTLSVAGAAADSKAVGDEFNVVDGEITDLKSAYNMEYTVLPFTVAGTGYIKSTDGGTGTTTGQSYTDYINIADYTLISYKRTWHTVTNPMAGMAFYNAQKQYLSGVPGKGNAEALAYESDLMTVAVPTGAVYARFTTINDTTTAGSFYISGKSKIVSGAMDNNIKNMILNCLTKLAWANNLGDEYIGELRSAFFPAKTANGLTAVFTQGNNAIYPDTPFETISQYLVVKATFNDNTESVISYPNYTLSGKLKHGICTMTVEYAGYTATFNVTVSEYWSYSLTDRLLITAGVLGNESNTECGIGLNKNSTQSGRRRSFTVDFGETPVPYTTTTTDLGEWKPSTYYPIKVPEGATNIVVSVTPNTQYIVVLTRRDVDGIYTALGDDEWSGDSGYTAGSNSKTLVTGASDNMYIFVSTKYNNTGTTYPTEPSALQITFS